MKLRLTISLLFVSLLGNSQINLVEHFGNVCAAGESIIVHNQKIHIAGSTCLDIGNNQFRTAGFIARYDLSANLEYYSLVGDTIRDYEAEELLIDKQSNRYILGDFQRDSLGFSTNAGIFIQKRDSNDQILWTIENQDTSSNISYFLLDGLLVEDKLFITGGYIPGGNIVPGVPEQDILFMIFDTSGALLSKGPIGDNLSQEKGHEIINFSDNRLIIASVKNFPGANSKNWVLMIDDQGNVLDEYISASNRRVGVWDIVKTQDGGLACASAASNGNFSNYRVKSYVEKLDSNLNQVWDYTIDDIFRDLNLATAITVNDNGDVFIGGNLQGTSIFDQDSIGEYGFIQKLNQNGDSIWYRNYTYFNNRTWDEIHRFYDLQIYNDNIFMVGDAKDWNNPTPPGQSMWLVSTDSNGVVSSLNEKITNSQDILVYPNPAREKLTLIMDQGGSASGVISVFNLQGQLIYTSLFEGSELDIDVSAFQPSLYILHVQTEDERYRIRFVKE
jgi:hypothetical protein